MPESLHVALSIPCNPPKTTADHRVRLEFYLLQQAKELEESEGRGEAFGQTYEVVKDQLLYLEGESARIRQDEYISVPPSTHLDWQF